MENTDKTQKQNGNAVSRFADRLPELLHNNMLLVAEILLCIILYIANRYAYQRDQAYAERLRRELVDMEYQALNTTSDVSAKSKPSYIENVAARNGSGLKPATEPPFILP